MNTAYDIKQKIFLMAIALGISFLLLGLNACQTMDTLADTAREVAGETMEKETSI